MEREKQQSEVARIRQQIADEYVAATYGLTGLALGTPRHEFITARMENMRRCQEQLNALVGEHEGVKLLAETLANL